MFANKIPLFSLLGFRVSLDYTWFLLAILIVWSLSRGYFPGVIADLPPETALLLGVFGALGLFASIIFHEFSHALVARRFDIPVSGITLFIFGGVAEMEAEPPDAKSEFLMAIAGPIASFVLAGLFYSIALALPEATARAPFGTVFLYLGLINGLLATFNLIPAFPLDGGRVLRAAVWWWTGDLQRATTMAATTGRVLGSLLMALGLFSIVTGNLLAGMWQALIGLFIIGAAKSSESHTVMATALHDVPVRRLMVADPVTIPAETTVNDLIETYFYRYSHKAFPVTRDGRLLGCINLGDVGKLDPADRDSLTAGDLARLNGADPTVPPDSSVLDALKVMRDQTASRLMVAENGTLRGMLTMRDITNFVTIRREIGDGPSAPDHGH
jgi:Zn-dependent protease